MQRFPDANNDPNPGMVCPDPNRPPQLNESNRGCGCLCSRGADDDGGGSDEDGASTCSLETLVESNGSEADEHAFPPGSDGPEEHVHLEIFEMELPNWQETGDINEFLNRFGMARTTGMFALDEAAGIDEHAGAAGPAPQHYHDAGSSNSMRTQPGSEDIQSVVTANVRSCRCISPGPELGAWTSEEWALGDRRRPPVSDNLFLASPLRLTPLRRYCRGSVASHLVLRDVDF